MLQTLRISKADDKLGQATIKTTPSILNEPWTMHDVARARSAKTQDKTTSQLTNVDQNLQHVRC